ncbi:hypothetical protein, partial [Planktothricoides raciborskii]
HNQTRNRVSGVFSPNFWLITRRNPVSHVPRCDRSNKKPGFSCFLPKFFVNSEKKPGFSCPKMRSPKQETGFLVFSAQIFGEFREETRFLMPQDAIAPPNFHNQTRNRVSYVFSLNFW